MHSNNLFGVNPRQIAAAVKSAIFLKLWHKVKKGEKNIAQGIFSDELFLRYSVLKNQFSQFAVTQFFAQFFFFRS